MPVSQKKAAARREARNNQLNRYSSQRCLQKRSSLDRRSGNAEAARFRAHLGFASACPWPSSFARMFWCIMFNQPNVNLRKHMRNTHSSEHTHIHTDTLSNGVFIRPIFSLLHVESTILCVHVCVCVCVSVCVYQSGEIERSGRGVVEYLTAQLSSVSSCSRTADMCPHTRTWGGKCARATCELMTCELIIVTRPASCLVRREIWSILVLIDAHSSTSTLTSCASSPMHSTCVCPCANTWCGICHAHTKWCLIG